MGNALIMGRLTYESIGRPLPGRHTIVLSRSPVQPNPGVLTVSTVDDAIEAANQLAGTEILIGGGEQIYRLFLPIAQRIYLTEIHATFGGDRHFPEFGEADFALVTSDHRQSEVLYTYLTYERCRAPMQQV